MEETTQMKVRSIRADETVLDRFKEISEEFPNQSAALDSIIAAWETQNAKAVLSGMETDITDFESHLKSIQSAFLHVLDMNQNAEKRIRMDFKAQLESKDKTIIELQERVGKADEAVKAAELNADEIAQKANAQAQEQAAEVAEVLERADRAEKAQRAAEQAAQAAEQARTATAETLETIKEQLAAAKSETATMAESVKELKKRADRADKAESELAATRAEITAITDRAAIEKENAILAERNKSAEQAAKAAEKSTAEIKSLYEKINELNEKIRQLSEENYRLVTDKANK
jgi:chromosome segregation ATPase